MRGSRLGGQNRSTGTPCFGIVPRGSHARFLGVDSAAYPSDFRFYAIYHDAIRSIPARYPLPGPLGLGQLALFLGAAIRLYAVDWLLVPPALIPTGLRQSLFPVR